jgi:hypothetical protein
VPRERTLVQEIEGRLGHVLTDEQKQQVTRAATQSAESLKVGQERYLQEVARATSLRVDQAREILPRAGQVSSELERTIFPKMEKALGHPLTQQQRQAVTRADTARTTATQPVVDRLAEDLSRITTLAPDQLREAVQKVGLAEK